MFIHIILNYVNENYINLLASKLVVVLGSCSILTHGKKLFADLKQLEQATANEQPLHEMSSHVKNQPTLNPTASSKL